MQNNLFVKSVFAIIYRQVGIQGINIISSIFIARNASPAIYGIYGIVIFTTAFASLIVIGGFGASLIKAKTEPSKDEYDQVFTFQAILFILIGLIICVSAPYLSKIYGFGVEGALMFILIGVSLSMSSLQSNIIIKLERHLKFNSIAHVEVLQAVVFQVFSMLLVYLKLGVISFGIAFALRVISGILLSRRYITSNFGVNFGFTEVKKHFKFSFAFQLGSIINFAKDAIMPFYIGVYLGAYSLGLINWSHILATYAVMIIMPISRLYLPFLSKHSDDLEYKKTFIKNIILVSYIVVGLLMSLTLPLIDSIVKLVYGSQWLGALNLVYIFSIPNIMVVGIIPLIGYYNSKNLPSFSIFYLFSVALVTWIASVPLVRYYGTTGFAISNAISESITIFFFIYAYFKDKINILPSIIRSFTLSIPTSIMVIFLRHLISPESVWNILIIFALSTIFYFLIGLLMFRSKFIYIYRFFGRSAHKYV